MLKVVYFSSIFLTNKKDYSRTHGCVSHELLTKFVGVILIGYLYFKYFYYANFHIPCILS